MSNDKKKKDLARIIAGRMAGTKEQIDAVRSTRGQIKGTLTKDTLYRLRQAVSDHQKADEKGAEARLAVILGLCDTYIQRHGKEDDPRAREKLDTVDRIQEQAMAEMRDWGQKQAQGKYLEDAYAKGSAAPNSAQYSATRMTEQTYPAGLARLQTKRLAQNKPGQQEGFNQATLDLINKYGLTEAEVLAVKIYSASDYKYINPATANSESWMKAQNSPKKKAESEAPPAGEQLNLSQLATNGSEKHLNLATVGEDASEADRDFATALAGASADDRELLTVLEGSSEDDRELWQLVQDTVGDAANLPADPATPLEDYFATTDGRSHLKRLFEEGSLHGAIAITALRKLPALEGVCYRGERMTEADFIATYGTPTDRKLPILQRPNLTSIATDETAARKFANGSEETRRDATVSVLIEITVKNGRDIGDLSIFGRREKEWLLLPGTVLKTVDVNENQRWTAGNPRATKWALIQAEETSAV